MTEIVFHNDGVLMRDGLVATGNNCCCCECSFPLPEGAPAMTVRGSWTLPDDAHNGACLSGTFDFDLPLIWSGFDGVYYACHEVDFSPTINAFASCTVVVFCYGGKITSYAYLYATECIELGDPAPFSYCNLCQGQASALGPDYLEHRYHDRVEYNGFCLPRKNQLMQWDFDCQPFNAFDGYHIEYEIDW